jgi:hypothetical protein
MKKMFIIMAVAVIAAYSANAQQSVDLSALQQQLSELSAKIAQLEKANAEKTALVEQTAQVENANAAKIAQIEQENAKKTWSIEQLQAEGKKNMAGAWANDIKLKGDIRARYEKREVSDATTAQQKDRQRIRLRLGAYGKINDQADFGIRLATGGSRTSSNVDMNDNAGMKNIYLDQAYVDMHPEQIGGAHVFLGKMPQPWMTAGTGLIWDTDLNPEGVAVTYEKQLLPFKLMANAGTFVLTDNLSDDIRLHSGQVAVEKKIGNTVLTLGASDYFFQNAENVKVADSLTGKLGATANTPNGQFNLVEGFGSYGFNIGKLPVLLNGQYVVNTDAASSEDTAYLAGVTVGKAKDKGTWEIGYSYRDIGRDAVVAGLNDSDFAGETWVGCYGHKLNGKYQIAKNLAADLAYILSTDYKGRDANTLQADLNFKF